MLYTLAQHAFLIKSRPWPWLSMDQPLILEPGHINIELLNFLRPKAGNGRSCSPKSWAVCLMLFVMLVCHKKKLRILIYCGICWCSRISIEKGVKPNRILSPKWVIGILLIHRDDLSTFLCNRVRSMLFLSFSQSFQESKPEKNSEKKTGSGHTNSQPLECPTFEPAKILKNSTLWWTNSLQLNMAIEIVDFPIKNGDFPLLC